MTKEQVKEALSHSKGVDIAKALKEYFQEKANARKTGQLQFEAEVEAVFTY